MTLSSAADLFPGERSLADRHPLPDAGVTVVVGLVLAVAIVTALLINYQLKWVPNQQESRQDQTMQEVGRQMGVLTSTMGTQLLGDANTTVSTTLEVGVPGASFPFTAPVSHQLALENDTGVAGVNLSADSVRVLERDGRSLAGLDERWTSVPGTNDSVDAVEHARLRYPGVTQSTGDVEVHVTDDEGANAGWLNVTVGPATDASASNFTIRVTVEDDDGDAVYDHTTYHDGPLSDPWFLDLLDPRFGFAQVVGAANAPKTVDVSGDSSVDYALTYERQLADGTLPSAAGGAERTDWSLNLSSDAISYEGDNPNFVDQTLTVENGALVLDQREGTAFLAEPLFTADVLDGNVTASLTLPRLTVEGTSLSGDTSATIRTTTISTSSLETLSNNLTLDVRTQHPDAWAGWLDDAMVDADVPATFYTVTPRASSVTLEITGDPAHEAAAEDVHLALHHARIRARILT